jgi:ADP-heptose:LPS heptosyltransferase
MHLLESFALASGATIDKCFIKETPIRLPKNKYITFHAYSPKGSLRNYSHWQNVIDNLLKHPKFNYTIVQIGENNDPRYKNIDVSYLGKTTYSSLAYLIRNSELHFGFDSLPIHLASHYDKKIVGLFVQYATNTGPFFNQDNETICIQATPKNLKPVFDEKCSSDRIDTIKSTLISNSIIELLFGDPLVTQDK